MDRSGRARELVYCHGCDNEFWKDEHGLTCPSCHSEFTEVIEQDHDPREPDSPPELLPHPFADHHPWRDTPHAPDPDEDDIQRYESRSDNGRANISFSTSFYSSPNGPGGQTRDQANPFANNILSHMFGGIGQAQGQRQQEDMRARSEAGGGMNPGQARVNIFHNGPRGFVFSTGSGPEAGNGGGFGHNEDGMPVNELHLMLGNLFNTIQGRQEMRNHADGAQGPLGFAGLLNTMLNPASARMGDAVYSTEAFDRVLSQLMEQHQSGNAPGPASEAAIAGLPRRAAGPKELGEEGKADCSICMDPVTAGVEINVLPCGHWFHPDCVKAWLSEHDTCPVCRAGIMPKDGSRDSVREPSQAPLNDENPAMLARRQSNSQDNRFIVAESPTRERRLPGNRRHPTEGGDVGEESEQADAREGNGSRGSSSGRFWPTDRVRNLFGGGSSSPGNRR